MWIRVSSWAGSPGRSFTSRTLWFFGAVIHSSMRIYYNLTVWHATSFKLGPRREACDVGATSSFSRLSTTRHQEEDRAGKSPQKVRVQTCRIKPISDRYPRLLTTL